MRHEPVAECLAANDLRYHRFRTLERFAKGSRKAYLPKELLPILISLSAFLALGIGLGPSTAWARFGDGAIRLEWTEARTLEEGTSALTANLRDSMKELVIIEQMHFVLVAQGQEKRASIGDGESALWEGLEPGTARLELRYPNEVSLTAWEVAIHGELTTGYDIDFRRGTCRESQVHAQPFGNWMTWSASELDILPGFGEDALTGIDTREDTGLDSRLDGYSFERWTRYRTQPYSIDRGLVGAQTPVGSVSAAIGNRRRWVLTRPTPGQSLEAGGTFGTSSRGTATGGARYRFGTPQRPTDVDVQIQYLGFDDMGPSNTFITKLQNNDIRMLETRGQLNTSFGSSRGRLDFYAFGFERYYYLHEFAQNLPHSPREDRASLLAAGAFDFDLGPSRVSFDVDYNRDYLESADGKDFDDLLRYNRPDIDKTTPDGLYWLGDDPDTAPDEGHQWDHYVRNLAEEFHFRIDTKNDFGSPRPLRAGFEYQATSWRFYEHLAPTQASSANGDASGYQNVRYFGYSTAGDTHDAPEGHEAQTPMRLALYGSQEVVMDNAKLEIGLRYEQFKPGQRPIKDRSNPLGGDGEEEGLDDSDLGAEPSHTGVSPVVGLYLQPWKTGHVWVDGGRTLTNAPYTATYYDPDFLALQAGLAQFPQQRFGETAIHGNPALKPESTWSGQIGLHQNVTEQLSARATGYWSETTDTWVARRHEVGSVGRWMDYYENRGKRRKRGLQLSGRYEAKNGGVFRVHYHLSQAKTTVIEPGPLYAQLRYLSMPVQDIADNEMPLGYAQYLDDGRTRDYFTSLMDQRHRISATFIVPITPASFGFAKSLIAPGQIAVALRAGSGLPFSPTYVRKEGAIEDALDPAVPVASAEPNTERTDWTWTVDAGLSQSFQFLGQEFIGRAEVQNLFNVRNATSIYGATGKGDDDGWLASPAGGSEANQGGDEYRQAYTDRIENPTNFGDGVSFRLGLSLRL